MSLYLAYARDGALLGSGRPVIKRAERQQFADAAALLDQLVRMREDAAGEIAAARDAARADGFAEGRAAAQAMVEDALDALTVAIDGHVAAWRADVADAAFAAARAIVGDLGDEEALTRIVDRSLQRIGRDKPVTIEVAPEMADRLTARLGEGGGVTVRALDGFGPTDCRIATGDGQTIASLSVQFDALAARWGIARP